MASALAVTPVPEAAWEDPIMENCPVCGHDYLSHVRRWSSGRQLLICEGCGGRCGAQWVRT